MLGTKAGNLISGNYTLQDCEGNKFTLEELCGASAAWLNFGHEWCPHCRKSALLAPGIAQDFAGKNLAIVNVLVQTSSKQTPTAADCKDWRGQYGGAGVLTLIDTSMSYGPLLETNYTNLSVFLDKNRVIVSKSHSDDKVVLKQNIVNALGN